MEKISKEDYEKALLIKERFENSCSKCGNRIGNRWEYSANSFKLNLNIDCQSTKALFGERESEIGFNHPAIAKGSGYQGVTIESGINLPFKLCPSCNREFAKLVGSFMIACL
jgi:DNA-directed RNA polymerase subunit RPC12/RpoP